MNLTFSTPNEIRRGFDPIDAAVVTFAGFTQAPSPTVGVGRLHARIEQLLHDRRRESVELRSWDSDFDALAAWITAKQPDQIIVIGYSYGCGWALKQFAARMKQLGRSIDLAFLIDPVPRFRVLKPLAYTRAGKYKIPANVEETHYWRQLNAGPYGREPVHPDAKPVICRRVYGAEANIRRYATPEESLAGYRDTGATHSTIDDRDAIHDAILDKLKTRLL